MKLLFSLTLFLTLNILRADSGTCALYKCKVTLNNQDTLIGYFQITGRDNQSSNEEDFFRYIKSQFVDENSSTISLYLKIQTIEYPKYKWSNNIKYSAVAIEDQKLIEISNIQSLGIIEMTSCECVKKEGATNYDYSKSDFVIQYYHPLIKSITQKEIDLLNSKKPKHTNFVQVDSADTDVILTLNYSTNLDQVSFDNLSNKLKFAKENNQSWEDYSRKREKHIKEIQELLRKKGIIIIQLITYT